MINFPYIDKKKSKNKHLKTTSNCKTKIVYKIKQKIMWQRSMSHHEHETTIKTHRSITKMAEIRS